MKSNTSGRRGSHLSLPHNLHLSSEKKVFKGRVYPATRALRVDPKGHFEVQNQNFRLTAFEISLTSSLCGTYVLRTFGSSYRVEAGNSGFSA